MSARGATKDTLFRVIRERDMEMGGLLAERRHLTSVLAAIRDAVEMTGDEEYEMSYLAMLNPVTMEKFGTAKLLKVRAILPATSTPNVRPRPALEPDQT